MPRLHQGKQNEVAPLTWPCHSFYRNPDEVDAENAAAAKLDRAAAQRRSAIRREPSTRPGHDQSSSAGLTNIIRHRQEMSAQRARVRAQYDSQEADMQIEILEAELERLRRLRQRPSNRGSSRRTLDERRINEDRWRRIAHQIEDDLSTDAASPVATDVYLTSSENESMSNSSSSSFQILLPRPARESNLRFEVAAATSTQPASPQQPTSFMPSPPHSVGETSGNRPVDGPLESWDTTPPLTQGFAPARATQDEPDGPTDGPAEATRITNENGRPGLETPPPEAWENSYPPLRRVPHMSPRPLPRNTVDGLGDRHRSPTPSDVHEEETWNTILSTMEHEHRASSASTSFATELLDTSRSSSHRSSSTQNTSVSFGEIGVSADDTCDPPPGITEEDVRQIRERHRRTAGRVMPTQRHILESRAARNRRGDETSISILADDSPLSILLDEAREARLSQERQRRRDELFMIQAIAERQQSHEGIPDEWWALAGLPPGLGRPRNDG